MVTIMSYPSFQVWLILLFTAVQTSGESVIYVNSTYASGAEDGSSSNPYSDLTTALVMTGSSLVTVILEPGETPYTLATLGSHGYVNLNCEGNSLVGVYTILVLPGVTAEFHNCRFSSLVTDSVLMAVLGTVVVTESSISDLSIKAFGLYGSLTIRDSNITGNSDSLVATSQFGFSLTIERCLFQMNVALAGTIIAISLTETSVTSTSLIHVGSSVFIGNAAYMGGSILLITINSGYSLPASQVNDTRLCSFTNNVFLHTPGYAFLLFSKYMNYEFVNNNFTSCDYPFVVKLYDSEISIVSSVVNTVNRFFTCTYHSGRIALEDLVITHILEGPVIFIPNSGPVTGLVHLRNLQFYFVNLTNSGYYSSTIMVINTIVTGGQIYTDTGFSYFCVCGCFFVSQVELDNIKGKNLTVGHGGLIATLFSSSQLSNLFVEDLAILGSGVIAFFQSTSLVNTVTMRVSHSVMPHFSRPNYSLFIMFNSKASIRNVYTEMPAVDTTSTFYCWNSVVEVRDAWLTVQYANVVNLYSTATIDIRNVTVIRGLLDQVITLSFYSHAIATDFLLQNMKSRVSAFTVLNGSLLEAERIILRDVTLPGLVNAANSKVIMVKVEIERMQIDTLFLHIRQR